jgi:hypothetical protein
LTGADKVQVVDVPTQFDLDVPLIAQVAALINDTDVSAVEWQSERLVVNLPGYAPAAAVLLAELHGRMGHFPSILHMHRASQTAVTEYEVHEIINLDQLRAVDCVWPHEYQVARRKSEGSVC